MSKYLHILRPRQWYKNLLVFLALFFSFNIFDATKLKLSIMGFIALCILSSANYIFNDAADIKTDRGNFMKSHKAIAAGKISRNRAMIAGLALLSFGLWLAYSLNKTFFVIMVFFEMNSTLYSLYFKKEIFIDIISIAVNFVLRAVSGAVLIGVYISPWLIMVPFFLSIFLSIGKRRAELNILGKKAYGFRKSLSLYSENLTNSLMMIATAVLVVDYTFYAISTNKYLLATLPFVLYAIFRYFYFIYEKPIMAISPENTLKDPKLLFSIIMWLILTFIVLYQSLL